MNLEIEMNIENFNRTKLIQKLVKKHKNSLKSLKSELEEKNKLQSDTKRVKEEALNKRNELNKDVEQLKEKRKNYYKEVNNHRRKFFILMEKLDDIEQLSSTIVGYRKQLEDMDWKIQTSALSINDERKMIDQIKYIYDQITIANKESQQKLGIEKDLREITKNIGNNLMNAQQTHELLIKKAEEAELHHKNFIENSKNFSELSIQINRINRKIVRSKESFEYWSTWIKTGDKTE